MPTIGAFLQLWPAGFHGAGYRSTDATVFCVAEGRGRSLVGDNSFEWVEHDIFVVPSGVRSRTKPGKSQCCSVSRIVRRKRLWACGAKTLRIRLAAAR